MRHVAHRMAENSLAAHASEEPKLTRRTDLIYAFIAKHGPHTDRELMRAMGFTDMNSVRPRITELIDTNKLMHLGDVRCSVTGKMVRRVDIRRARKQDELPW